jgi:gentisate 1,2-dioxygenase
LKDGESMSATIKPDTAKPTHLAPGEPVPGRDTPYTRRALYYTPPNSFTFSLPGVPVHRFVAERDRALAGAATGVVALDLSQHLATNFPATTPTMLARYVRLAPGDRLTTAFKASGEIWYVIVGDGRTSSGGATIDWQAGDLFCLPGGHTDTHAAGPRGALLYVVTNEPTLAFERLEPPRPGAAMVEPVLYPAQEIQRQLRELCIVRGHEDIAGKAVMFTSEAMLASRTIFPSLSVGLNIFEPGDHQKAHRHNAAALTLCLTAKPGAHSRIDGQRVDWEDHLVLLTPPGAAHSHHNESDEPMLALVIQDGGLYYHTRAVGFSFA